MSKMAAIYTCYMIKCSPLHLNIWKRFCVKRTTFTLISFLLRPAYCLYLGKLHLKDKDDLWITLLSLSHNFIRLSQGRTFERFLSTATEGGQFCWIHIEYCTNRDIQKINSQAFLALFFSTLVLALCTLLPLQIGNYVISSFWNVGLWRQHLHCCFSSHPKELIWK